MKGKAEISGMNIGVVGLGLMGSSIVAALLAAGHRVKAVAPIPSDMAGGMRRIEGQLAHCSEAGLLDGLPGSYLSRLKVSEDYDELADCRIVLECVIEDVKIKASVYKKIMAAVGRETIIGTNTSAIPISELQEYIPFPGRFMGIHWAEPAYATRFLEITCGDRTDPRQAERIFDLAHSWGKEPTILRKDIRGFITNRLMYAVYREALHLAGTRAATLEDMDKAFRYDVGSWMTLMGIFRRMDYMGLAGCAEVLKTVFSQLDNNRSLPALMHKMLKKGHNGTRARKGFYTYSTEEAEAWEEAFAHFNRAIYDLAARYPSPLPAGGREEIMR